MLRSHPLISKKPISQRRLAWGVWVRDEPRALNLGGLGILFKPLRTEGVGVFPIMSDMPPVFEL